MKPPMPSFEQKVIGLLQETTADIPGTARDRLFASRQLALGRFRESRVALPVWLLEIAGAGGSHGRMGRLLLAGLLTAALMGGGLYWTTRSGSPGNELADLDTRLLTDDLPIEAYLDKSFDAWLKRQQR